MGLERGYRWELKPNFEIKKALKISDFAAFVLKKPRNNYVQNVCGI